MASYDAAINVIISGQQKVDSLISSVSKLENVIGSIKTTPIDINLGPSGNITKQLRDTQNQVKRANNQINSLYSERNKTIEKIGKLNETIIRNEQILEKSAPSTQKYKNAERVRNNAIEKQIQLQEELNDLMEKSSKISSARSSIIDSQEELQGLRKKIRIVQILANSYLEYGDARKYSEETGLGKRGDLVKNETSIAQIKQQIAGFEQLTNNAKIASKEFNRFAIATELASIKAGKAQQERLRALSEAFSKPKGYPGVLASSFKQSELAGARGAIDSLIGSYGGIVKSEAALSSYIGQLQSLQSLVPYLSEEYNRLERAIGDVSAEMESLQKMTQLRGAVSKIQPQAGPASLLPGESVKSAAEKSKYYSRIDDQVSRLAGFEERIAQANLTQTQKLELRSRLDKALSLLAENRLDDAKRETVEIERQRMSLERMNRAAEKPAPRSTPARPLGPSIELGTGAELRERVKYEAEQVKLRGQIAKATNDAAAAVQRLEAAQGRISMVQQFEEIQSGIKGVGDEVDSFLAKDKKALADFDKKLRETSNTIKQVKQGVAVDLGGGAELKERTKFEQTREQNRRRLNNIIASGAIIEQGLINLQGKGVDVAETLTRLQKSLNGAKLEDFNISKQTLDVLSDQVSLAGKFAQLQNKILSGQGRQQKVKEPGAGLTAALEKLREARAARVSFLGEGVSPVEAIDKIVREFGTKKDIGAGAGTNVANTLASEIAAGTSKATAAGKGLGDAAEKGLNQGLEIKSPSGVAIRAAQNVINTLVNIFKQGKALVQSALQSLFSGFKLKNTEIRTEFEQTLDMFREQMASLTTKPRYFKRLLSGIPDTGLTVDMAGSATDVFNQIKLPDILEGQIKEAYIKEFGQLPSFFKDLVRQIKSILDTLKAPIRAIDTARQPVAALQQRPYGLLPAAQSQAKPYGLLPQATIETVGDRFEARIRQAHERSAARGAEVLAEDAARGLERAYEAAAGVGGRFLPPSPPVPPGGGGASGAGDAGDFNRRLTEAAARGPQALLGLEELRQPARASINELNALAAVLTELRSVLDPTAAGFDRLDNQLRETLATVSRQLEVRAPEADFLTRRTGDPRLARGISEGVIGGAFPLLFGQGIGASVGGGLGGFAGGFAGGGLGFGLSLVGTALGTAFDTLNQAAQDTGKALNYPIEGFEKLKEANIFASREQEYYISKLIETGKASRAAALIQSRIVEVVGVSGANDLMELGDAASDLGKKWAELNYQMQALIAGPVGDFLKLLSKVAQAKIESNRMVGIGERIAGLTPEQRKLFEQESRKFSGSAAEYQKAAEQILNRIAPERLRQQKEDPKTQEEQLRAAQQAADEIKQAYREGFKLQQQAIDLERQAADFRRRIADDIFNKQQEVFRAQVEADRLSADVRIKAVDLEYQKRIGQEEGRVAQLLEAEAELIRVKAAGQADIDSKKRLLELDIAKQERDTQNYVRDVNTQINNIRRQTLQYEMDVQDAREASERRIAELRRIDQMGAALSPTQTAPNGRPYYGPGGAPAAGRIPSGAMTSRRRDPDAEATGWDIVMPGGRGASVRAPLDLTITGTGFQGGGAGSGGRGYGNWISGEFTLGGKKYELLLGHFDQVNVARGMRVPAGGELGKQGITGRTFGSHVTTHVNPMRGASVNDAWNALEQITQVWERGAMPNTQARQMQQAQSQIRPVNIPMVDAAAVGQRMTELDSQDAQIRRSSLELSQQILNLEEQSALQKIIGIARGAKELEQRKYQLNLLGLQIKQTVGLKDQDRERGMLAAEYLADVQRTADANAKYLEQARLEPTERQAVLKAFEEGFKIRKQQYDLDVKILAMTQMEAAARGARESISAFVEQNKQLDLEIQKRKIRIGLIAQGNSPQQIEAEMRIIDLEKDLARQLEIVNKSTNDQIRAEAQRLGITVDMVDSTFKLTEATLQSLVATENDTEKKREYRQELEKILIARNALEGEIKTEAAGAIQTAQAIAKAQEQALPGEKVANAYAEVRKQLQDLATWENVSVTGAQAIGDAFGQAFGEIAQGTATAQEILAGFFQNLANAFSDMASQMISQMIQMLIFKQLLGVFAGSPTFTGGYFNPVTGLGAAGPNYGFAEGGVFGAGIRPFAMGGVVNSPTLFKFANGGAMSTGVMGEAGPEAILPLSRGSDGKLGVSASGSGGGDVNVTVNVDAKGSKVQGDDQSANQLGKAVAAAVQQELLKQKRPGGLL